MFSGNLEYKSIIFRVNKKYKIKFVDIFRNNMLVGHNELQVRSDVGNLLLQEGYMKDYD